MRRIFTLAIIAVMLTASIAIGDVTIAFMSDGRPKEKGEAALKYDFDQLLVQMDTGWMLDAVQHIGDMDYIAYEDGENTVAAYAASAAKDVPLFHCIGNHELNNQEDLYDVRAAFEYYPFDPVAGPAGTDHTTYYYEVGDMLIVVLNEYWDGNNDGDGDWKTPSGGPDTDDSTFKYSESNGGYIPDELFNWLANVLSTSTKTYKLVVGHEPAYPVDRHIGDSLDQDPANRDKFWNLLKTKGVAAYMTAHDHNFHLDEHDGVFEADSGVCGGMLGGGGPGENDNFATIIYAHIDDQTGNFEFKVVHEQPGAGNWGSPDNPPVVIRKTLTPPSPWATNPNPPDEATEVDVDADLSWTTGVGAESHDVYFGTNPEPGEGEFQVNQTETTYVLWTLANDTTYYWRIDEFDGSTTHTGSVWSFTTAPVPGQASNPNPDGTTLVAVDADLNWTAGDGAESHDVYLGTDLANLPLVSEGQSETTYDPGILVNEEIYYWRIDEVGPGGTTSGDVWSFTTAPLPSQASNPSPADGAIRVNVDTVLSWTAGSDTTSHNVYFGTDSASLPLVSEEQMANTYSPGTLELGTTYYWQIDEIGPGGITTGAVWSFTTAALPWSDGFESGDLATGGWVTSGQVQVTDDAFTGSYAVRTNRAAWIEKAVSTIGFTSIQVKYARKTFGMDSGEYLYVEWSTDGSNWNNLETTQATEWSLETKTCGTGANENPGFRVRFRSNSNKNREYAYVDDVEIAGIPSGPDNEPPAPDPMYWAQPPTATGENSIIMTATTASDYSGVEYYFDCTAGGGNDSGWQDSPTYEDTGLQPGTIYTYRVKARDKSPNYNETGLSDEASATTDVPDTTAPTPNPMTWATLPYATGSSSIAMTATTASDPSGVEYYFACTTDVAHDSGWQDIPTYEDTGLDPDTEYTYTVQARDKSPNQNLTGWSEAASATTDPPDTTPPSPDPMTWAIVPYATGSSSIAMTATTADDPSGVEYYFTCTAGGGNDSGWQDSPNYEDTGLSPETPYTYTVKARDTNYNETGVSTGESATTDIQTTEVVTIVRAEYRIRQKVLTVQATSSQEGGVAGLTVFDATMTEIGTMTYDAEEDQYQLRLTDVADPPATVTVESDLGGSATAPVTHK